MTKVTIKNRKPKCKASLADVLNFITTSNNSIALRSIELAIRNQKGGMACAK